MNWFCQMRVSLRVKYLAESGSLHLCICLSKPFLSSWHDNVRFRESVSLTPLTVLIDSPHMRQCHGKHYSPTTTPITNIWFYPWYFITHFSKYKSKVAELSAFLRTMYVLHHYITNNSMEVIVATTLTSSRDSYGSSVNAWVSTQATSHQEISRSNTVSYLLFPYTASETAPVRKKINNSLIIIPFFFPLNKSHISEWQYISLLIITTLHKAKNKSSSIKITGFLLRTTWCPFPSQAHLLCMEWAEEWSLPQAGYILKGFEVQHTGTCLSVTHSASGAQGAHRPPARCVGSCTDRWDTEDTVAIAT